MVPHMRLLKKLRGYGLYDKLIDWFSSFLQRVVFGDCESDWCEVKSHVRSAAAKTNRALGMLKTFVSRL